MLRKILYWAAVVAVSVALVVGLILWLESRDASKLEDSHAPSPLTPPA
jgi:cytochrome b subunit of formate dehydrogenase